MRVFRVTLTRETTFTVAAESHKELEAALELARYDFDDWNLPDWEWASSDPLASIKKPADLKWLPKKQAWPDMGVTDGEVVSFGDLPDPEATMSQIEETVLELARKIEMADKQVKLPGVE